jgi:oxygen-dependent protoporphyrinogen oxidase
VAKLSMAATMSQFWDMEQRDGSLYRATTRRSREGADSAEQNSAGARYEKFRSFPTGMGRFAEELAKRLDERHLHLNTRVQSLVKTGGDWKLTWTTGDDGSVIDSTFSHVIVATPARIAAKLIADVVPEASRELEAIRFASSAVVVFGVRETDIEQKLAIAGFIVPIQQRRKIIAVSFTGDKFAGRTPQGYKLLRVFIGGELQPELLSLSDSQLVDLAKDELKELIGLRGEPVLTKVVRWNDAMPQYHVGHVQRLKVIQAAVDQHRGLSLIGNSLHGVGIAPTIAYARKVALAVAAE